MHALIFTLVLMHTEYCRRHVEAFYDSQISDGLQPWVLFSSAGCWLTIPSTSSTIAHSRKFLLFNC